MRFTRRALGALALLQAVTVSACTRTVDGTVLVLGRTEADAKMAAAGLDGYGIKYETVAVPQGGFSLPQLNSTAEKGNYGGIVMLSEVSYEYTDGWKSAVTKEQFDEIYAYQKDFGVRMVRLDVFPNGEFGAQATDGGAGCCGDGVDQPVLISDDSQFKSANIKTGAGVSTTGLWHYPATVINSNDTIEFAQFEAEGQWTSKTTAGVINNFEGRQQMAFFISWATEWAIASNFLQHTWIHWMTRGIFSGKRKTYLGTQVDDVHLATELYPPAGSEFRLRAKDLAAHASWQADINSRLPAGSDYFVELAHNGNGAVEAATNGITSPPCSPDYAVYYDEIPDVANEWKKPLGTGMDYWDDEWTEYPWAEQCPASDELAQWFLTAANMDTFAHVSHTFTHEELNNATHRDAALEIQFNQAWLQQMGFTGAKHWSPKGIVPPAITGLHNGDAIRAWMENGITQVVGDNTRPALRNTESLYWPLITTDDANGHSGLVVMPRWATTIYYNCDSADCTLKEWIDTSGGSGDFANLLRDARQTNVRYLFGLHPDPYMFHQANLRQDDAPEFTVGDVSGKLSLLQIWVETITQELTRLTDWPVRTLKHDDIAQLFIDRMTLDQCNPNIEYIFSTETQTITGLNVRADGDSCGVPVPVTIPGSASASGSGVVIDQVGTEPIIAWTPLSGSAVSFTFDEPVAA